jgi:hypothetical protein
MNCGWNRSPIEACGVQQTVVYRSGEWRGRRAGFPKSLRCESGWLWSIVSFRIQPPSRKSETHRNTYIELRVPW